MKKALSAKERQERADKNMSPRGSELFVTGDLVRVPSGDLAFVVSAIDEGGFELKYTDRDEGVYLMPKHMTLVLKEKKQALYE